MAENTEIASEKQENKNLLSLLPKFQLNLPFFNQQPKIVSKESAKTTTASESDDNTASVKPNLVRFPDATRPILPAPLEFEAEEPAGRTSNPVVLWQVYAFGGFLVLRWIWARWQERKERSENKDTDDNESSPADEDDGYHSA